jgi:hypothetical protein
MESNSLLTPNTIELLPGSDSARDKLRAEKGNNPDRQLRSLNLS